jgi:hypothetical protein
MDQSRQVTIKVEPGVRDRYRLLAATVGLRLGRAVTLGEVAAALASVGEADPVALAAQFSGHKNAPAQASDHRKDVQ